MPRLDSLDKTLGALTTGAAHNPYCTPEVMQRAIAAGEENECFQRQELRVQKPHIHDHRTPYLYTIRFRMPAVVEDERNSVRWVTAQWKHEPVSKKYEQQFGESWSASPFLAQRFDDGVLHVTIQDEDCRCMVASAPFPDGSNLLWKDGPARYCLSTKPGDLPGKSCAAKLQVEYGADPILTSPKGRWVEMTYRVEARRDGKARIEITQDGRLIARVTGNIGYAVDPGQSSQTKFKFGPYRDYMPFVHTMDVDAVSFQPAAN